VLRLLLATVLLAPWPADAGILFQGGEATISADLMFYSDFFGLDQEFGAHGPAEADVLAIETTNPDQVDPVEIVSGHAWAGVGLLVLDGPAAGGEISGKRAFATIDYIETRFEREDLAVVLTSGERYGEATDGYYRARGMVHFGSDAAPFEIEGSGDDRFFVSETIDGETRITWYFSVENEQVFSIQAGAESFSARLSIHSTTTVPEPSGGLTVGALALAVMRRRRRGAVSCAHSARHTPSRNSLT